MIISVLFCALQVAHAGTKKDLTNWTDGGSDYKDGAYAYDEKWYENTTSDEYTISTPEEMGAFAKAAETETFEGKTVKLTADLDMEKYGWVSIGSAGFKGTFDGMGHTITNMTYRDATQIKSWGLFHTIDGGTVKNLIITKSTFTNEQSGSTCPSVGGVAAVMKGKGTIQNCGFSGAVKLPFAKGAELLGQKNGMVGGLVGVLEEGTIANCYVMNNAPVIPNDTIYGNIAGRSSENSTISNCYYLANDTLPGAVNVNQIQGTIKNADAKTADRFAIGEVAYLLNVDNKGVWGQYGDMPVLASDNAPVIFKVNYPEEQAHGKVAGNEYAGVGVTVALKSTTDEGYMIKDLKVSNATLVNYSEFVMPEGDVAVSYAVMAIPTDYIVAFPAEEIKSRSFVAKWNKVDGATGYKITVKDGDKIVGAYDALAVGNVTSALVEGLKQNTNYTYTVQSVKGEAVSEASNAVTVRTGNLVAMVADSEGHALLISWENVEGAVNYVVSMTDPTGAVTTVETADCEYRFTGLNVNAPYTVVVAAQNSNGENLSVSEPLVATTGSDYGVQLTNSTFEAWEKESTEAEPVGWNSFMSGDGSLAGFTKSVHMEKSNVTRPGTNGNVSVRIWTKGVIGSIVANGNLTCGRINSGSMEALSQENHNRTVVGDSEFSQPLHGSRPDSLTVWVNYTYLGDSVMNARVSAIIHDTYDCADPSSPADSVHIVAKAQLNYKAVDPVNGGWQRLSIPFDYELKDYEEFYEKMNNSDYWKDSLKVDHFVKPTSADYMLVTFATNSTPAVGKEGDQVLIDDMLLIYKPTLEFSKTDKGTYYPGSRIVADYILTGTMSPSNVEQDHNVVSLELSDAKGSFEKPTVLTQIATDKGGTLTATLSEELPLGDYKVRIVTTNYPMVSNELAVSVVAVPAIKAIEATEVKDDSFVANWEAPAEAEVTDYLLTVKEGDTVLEGYNERSTGKVTSYKVEGLTGDVNYTYTVKAVFGTVVSESSNEIAVTTRPVGIEKVTVEGNVTVYPNPVVNTLYINGVTENSAYSIYNQSGSMVASGSLTVNRVDVSALNSGVYFIETEAGKAKFIKK